jgi:hypothetical protein
MHATAKGTIAEKKFALRCLELGIPVLTPLIDQNGFDYVIQRGDSFEKIQVKSTANKDKRSKNSYKLSIKRGAVGVEYNESHFDYLVCYIFEPNLFYIIPFGSFSATTIRITPNSIKCKYANYKEAWCLLTES